MEGLWLWKIRIRKKDVTSKTRTARTAKAAGTVKTSASAAKKTAEGKTEKQVPAKQDTGEDRVFVSDMDCYLFGQGTHYDIYKNSEPIFPLRTA